MRQYFIGYAVHCRALTMGSPGLGCLVWGIRLVRK
jgi:hypothetical protein